MDSEEVMNKIVVKIGSLIFHTTRTVSGGYVSRVQQQDKLEPARKRLVYLRRKKHDSRTE